MISNNQVVATMASIFLQESFVSRPEKFHLYFLDEASNIEEQWTILATSEAVGGSSVQSL